MSRDAGVTVTAKQPASLTGQRLAVPQESCDVEDRGKLESYRALYRKWMGWYEHSPDNPNTIEDQVMSMIFHDLVYRSITSTRATLAPEIPISARSSTLAYVIDSGYLANQVLAITKLTDNGSGVISLSRLVKDVNRHRESITREVYVSGFGDPYDPLKWREEHSENDPMVQMWGLQAPSASRWLFSNAAHERFDALSGVPRDRRDRKDLIRPTIFRRIIEWLSIPEIDELKKLRNTFLAHAKDALREGQQIVRTARFSQLDKAQESIIRAERGITDCVLSIGISREVVATPPLGIFSGLDIPYSTKTGQSQMHARWDELKTKREGWKLNILQALVG